MSDLEKAEAINPELILADDDELQVPDIAPIRALHRHADGYVAFATKSEDEFHPLVSIRADELQTYFPEFQQQLFKDSFVSINAGYRLRNRQDRGKPKGYPRHDSNSLRYLCACYADLDHYKIGASFYETLARVVWAQDHQVIPPASIIVRSGRGMWLLWFLRDPKNPDQAAGAWNDKIDVYCKIQRAIGKKLEGLGADLAANDAARHIRVPGSLHTGHTEGSGFVTWWLQGSGNKGFTYTLDDLAAFFHVEPRKLHPKSREAFDEAKKPTTKRRRGWQALNSYRLRDFEILRSLRGGFLRGTRNNAAKIYAWLLRNDGLKRDEVERELYIFAGECRPSLAPSEVKAAASFVFKQGGMRKMLHQTIADWLNITPEESATLERLPPASQFGTVAPKPKPKPKPKRSAAAAPAPPTAADREQRLQAILELVGELGFVPSNRDLAARLTQRGFPVSHPRVIADCKKLGLKSVQTARKHTRLENEERQGTLDIS